MSNKNIVILDDRPYEIESYIDVLKYRGYKVEVFENPISLAAAIIEERIKVDLLILDIMLAGCSHIYFEGKFYETMQGYDAGLILGKALRENGYEWPIIFLSAVSNNNVINRTKELVNKFSNLAFLQKGFSNNATSFADSIDAFFKTGKLTKESSGIITLLSESLVLQPNFMGIGINLKKLVEKN